jgi:hypothetical protein
MSKKSLIFVLACTIALLLPIIVHAQENELILKMSRDWGYGGLNGDIQGLFSMKVSGPADLVKVEFYIDGTLIGEDLEAPFSFQFNTDSYSPGIRELYAMGYTAGGQVYQSNLITANFVTAADGNKASLSIVLPILSIAFVAILLSFVVPLLLGRGKTQNLALGAERKYPFGGVICSKCHRPFPLAIFSPHLGFHKVARCPMCGKWSLLRVQSIGKLREAEQEELKWGVAKVIAESAEEKLLKELDDSKYQN